MRILKVKVKNERLAQSLLQLIARYPDIQIMENIEIKEEIVQSKLDIILDKPYQRENFRVFSRVEIYEK